MEAFTVGARVRVAIQAPDEYTRTAVSMLDGRTGTLERFEPRHGVPVEPAWLVRFDHTFKLHDNATEGQHFWLVPRDLRPE